MKEKKAQILFFCIALLFAGLILARPGYYVYRELAYRLGQPTQAAQTVHTYAEEQGIPYGKYPKDLIELLENTPEAQSFVLEYPFRKDAPDDLSGYSRDTVPLFLQWDPMWGYEQYGSSYLAVTGCGPTCVAMVGYYLTGDPDMTPGKMAAFAQRSGYYAKGYGSSWTLISEGMQKLGFRVQELPLVKKKMITALEEGKPIILAMGEGDFTSSGHYIVLTGVEEGGFRVNDPNSRENSQKLWTYEQLEHQIRNIWAVSQ